MSIINIDKKNYEIFINFIIIILNIICILYA